MNRNLMLILGLIVVICGGAIAMVRIFLMETVTVTRDIGWQGEAARNPYLAAERFLEKMDLPVKGFRSFSPADGFPDSRGILIFATDRGTLGKARQQEILRWVATTGGHLMVIAAESGEGTAADLVMDYFHLNLRDTPYPAVEDAIQSTPIIVTKDEVDLPEDLEFTPFEGQDPPIQDIEPVTDQDNQPNLNLADVLQQYTSRNLTTVEGLTPQPLQVALGQRRFVKIQEDGHYPLEDDILLSASDKGGLSLLTLAHGGGMVTFLSEMDFLNNDHLKHEDHAKFIFSLIKYKDQEDITSPTENVWLVRQLTYPNLWSLLAEHAWPALVSLALLLLLVIWKMAPRFGAIVPDPPPIRRRLMEHITAAAAFMWDHHSGEALVKTTKDAFYSRIRFRHPHWMNMEDETKINVIADHVGLPAGTVQEVLETTVVTDEETFRQTIQHLEQMRRSL